MICPKCGKENPENTRNCSECGTALTVPPSEWGGIEEGRVAAFVGNNQPYYVTKWKMMKGTGSKVSWNWCGFLLSTYWLMYRKLYVVAAIKFVADIILSMLGTLGTVVSLALWVCMGLFGNYLYFQHMEKCLREADLLNEGERAVYLPKKGGTTIVPVVILLVLYVGLILLIGIGVAALLGANYYY